MKEAIKKALEERMRIEREEYLPRLLRLKQAATMRGSKRQQIGMIEGLKVARSRKSRFHSALLPYRASSSIELRNRNGSFRVKNSRLL